MNTERRVVERKEAKFMSCIEDGLLEVPGKRLDTKKIVSTREADLYIFLLLESKKKNEVQFSQEQIELLEARDQHLDIYSKKSDYTLSPEIVQFQQRLKELLKLIKQ